MPSQKILTIVLAFCSFVVANSEPGNTTVPSRNSTNKCMPAAMKKEAEMNEPVCMPYGLDGDIFKNGGYCKHIMNNLQVYGKDINELYTNEKKLRLYQMVKEFVLQTRENSTNWHGVILDSSFEVRQSCLDYVDDIYCHHYFKRCYFSSSPQQLCRESCDDLFLKLCDREVKLVSDFNKRRKFEETDYPFYWDFINCTTLPFRNESSNCYYPDKIRDKLNILESKDCYYGDGRGYRGNSSTTVSGYTCQSWDAQCPHKHNINGQIYEEIRNSSNFCRNAGGLGLNGTWCYTATRIVRWEYCDVPKCAKQPPSSPPTDFRGHNLSSTSIKVLWRDVPKPSVHGILLGFHVACEKLNCSDRQFAELAPEDRNWDFKGLEKFTNYSCWLRAFNNFGNGTWSEELVISTDEDVPSAPPESLEAWNLSSTSVQVQWGPIPTSKRHGKLLEYKVVIRPEEEKLGRKTPTVNYTTLRSLTFTGLKKYSKYVVSVYGLTRRGKGPDRVLTVQTDEDVPDRPPTDITALSLGTDAVQVEWNPVAPEYTNGEVLGYKVLYNHGNETSHANSTVALPEGTRLKIFGLRPSTNYSFQILAFTRKGDGVRSAKYFVTTLPDKGERPSTDYVYKTPSSATGVIIAAAVFASVVVLGIVFLAIYFVRKRRNAPNADDGNNGLHCNVTPYATSPLDWIERIVANHGHGYETMDDENAPTTFRRPLYINIAPDGSLNLPPYLRDIVMDFQHSYENTKYRRLHRRRRSLGGAVDIDGHPIYDKLERIISPCKAACHSDSCSQEAQGVITAETSKEYKHHHCIDLGELQGFEQAFQGDGSSTRMTEMGAVGETNRLHRRRFSVDLGEVREFIALREMRSSKDESEVLADQSEVQGARHDEATSQVPTTVSYVQLT